MGAPRALDIYGRGVGNPVVDLAATRRKQCDLLLKYVWKTDAMNHELQPIRQRRGIPGKTPDLPVVRNRDTFEGRLRIMAFANGRKTLVEAAEIVGGEIICVRGCT